tara:strand:+ start:156 stop:971 length:816 start_codon:yes stop_codon:yes gene_type:complete
MVKNLDQNGLKSIIDQYDLFFIDIWGVIHNGIKLNMGSIEVLDQITKNDKEFVLLTNAPRPNETVKSFLLKMGLKKYLDNVYTSGEAALNYLLNDFIDKKFFHIGPPRDFDLFIKLNDQKVSNIEEADYILCTGLFENYENNLSYYETIMKNNTQKKMICTNPDLVVDRGQKREFCAGAVANIFQKMNGEVIFFGKPYAPVYSLSINIGSKKVLCIGDNLNTDIKGANKQGFDSLLITSGIHRKEIVDQDLISLSNKYKVEINYSQTNLQW